MNYARSTLFRYLQKGKFKAMTTLPYHAVAAAPAKTAFDAYAQRELQLNRDTSLHGTAQLPEYSEELLTDFYHALQTPEPSFPSVAKLPPPTTEEHMVLLSERMSDDRKQEHDYKSVLSQLEQSVIQAEAEGSISLPVSVATKEEWLAVITSAVNSLKNFPDAAQTASSHPSAASLFEATLELCGQSVNAKLAVDVINIYQQAGFTPTAAMHHGIVMAYIKSSNTLAAQGHLRKMEDIGCVPAQLSYRAVIKALLISYRSQAWDLFAHMRLVSHPVPDVPSYNLMINACAIAKQPSPERAADLFGEMQEHRLAPTGQTYNALIKACSRTVRLGESPFYYQAIEYFRQMLNAGLKPTRGTLHALLMGCRTVGDLARARWVFQRMLRADPADDIAINQKTVALLFDTYAAYTPPKGRAPIKQEIPEEAVPDNANQANEVAPATQMDADDRLESPIQLPQSQNEVRKQLRGLLARVLVAHGKDIKLAFPDQQHIAQGEALSSIYSQIHLTPLLLNSFLSAHAKHSGFKRQCGLFDTLFEATGIEKNGVTFKLMMRACARPVDKAAGTAQARLFFAEWQEWADSQPLRSTEAQSVWLTYIHILARDNLTQDAIRELFAFYDRLPPSLILDHAKQTGKIATLAPRPKIGLADESYPETTQDWWQPPRFTHTNLIMLLKRLADNEELSAIRNIRHMIASYRIAEREAALIAKGRTHMGRLTEIDEPQFAGVAESVQ